MPEFPKSPRHFHTIQAPMMPRMPFRYVLLGLFLWPKLSLLTVRLQGGWFYSLLLIILCAIGGSAIKASLNCPKYVESARRLTTVVGEKLGTLQARNGKLQWSSEEELPQTHIDNDWRLDVLGQGDRLNLREIEQGIDTKGLVINATGIRFWFRSQDTGRLFPMNFDFPVPYLISFMEVYGKTQDNIPTITPEQLNLCPRRLLPLFFLCLACYHTSMYIQPVLLCSFIFVILTLIFRRERGLPFGNLLASALCSCIPPFLLALVYDQFPLGNIEYHSLFVTVFFIYLILILIDKSVYIPKQDNHSSDDNDVDF